MCSPDVTFTHSLPVRFADTDANGHVFFANYMTFFDTAFMDFLGHAGFGLDWFVKQGLNLYYVESTCRYRSALSFGDEASIQVWISKVGNTSFTTSFECCRKGSDQVAATGHIVSVVVDFKAETPVPIPESFKTALTSPPHPNRRKHA